MGEWKEYKLKDLTAKIGSGAAAEAAKQNLRSFSR